MANISIPHISRHLCLYGTTDSETIAIIIAIIIAILGDMVGGSRGVVTQSYSGRRYVGTVVEPHAYVKENETELVSEKTITRENY